MYTIKVKQLTKTLSKADYLKIQELRKVVPVLTKHSLHAKVQQTITDIRTAHKMQIGYSVSMSRMVGRQVFKYEEKVLNRYDAYPALKSMKEKIVNQIKTSRAERRKVVVDGTTYYAGREIHVAHGLVTKKQGRVYLETGVMMKIYKRKLRAEIFENKTPKTTEHNYVGVEIEFASKKNRDFIADTLFEAGLAPFISIKGDGSIKTDSVYTQAHEICVIGTQAEIGGIITKLCTILYQQCEVRVDKSCGLHVHLDMRNRDVAKSFSNLVSMQNILYRMVPAARKTCQYSRPTKGKTYRILDDRYHGINSASMRRHNTIECRIHSGTVDAVKINSWISLLVASADATKIKRAPTTSKGAQTALGLSDELTAYVEARIAKFATQHDGTATVVDEDSEAA
jgi:hypothetical protein